MSGREPAPEVLRRGYWRWLLLALALSVGALVLLGVRAAGEVFLFWTRASGPGLGLAFTVVVLLWLVEAARVQALVRTVGFSAPLRTLLVVNLAAAFVAAVTPASSGGPPAQVYFLSRLGLAPEKAAAAVTGKLLLNLAFFAVLAPPLFILYRQTLHLGATVQVLAVVGALGLTGIVMALFFLLLHSSLAEQLLVLLARTVLRLRPADREREAEVLEIWRSRLEGFRCSLLALLGTDWSLRLRLVLLTGAYWFGFFSLLPLLAYSLGLRINFVTAVGRQFLYYFLVGYVPLPGASGAAELSLAALLSGLVPGPLVTGLIAAWRFFTYHVNLLVGAPLIWWCSRQMLSLASQLRGGPLR
ncbi:MAG: lysylphosphatidylglycerol synthase transmembrane domain-containing protein [Moorellales bacterium]